MLYVFHLESVTEQGLSSKLWVTWDLGSITLASSYALNLSRIIKVGQIKKNKRIEVQEKKEKRVAFFKIWQRIPFGPLTF